MRKWKRVNTSSGVRIKSGLEAHEVTMLRNLVGSLIEMLDDRESSSPRDELAELTGMKIGPSQAPDDDTMRLARAASRQLALGSASQGVTSTLTFLAKLVHARAVVEIGTGTGAIALALKSERPDADVWAVDRMPAAAALARANSAALGLPIEVRDGSWFEPLVAPSSSKAPRFAMIVSNPPYIDGADPHLDEGDVRFEPRSALVADEQGLADIRLIVAGAPAHLCPGGWLLLEHGWEQGAMVRQLLLQQGYCQVETVRDYGDNERVTLGRLAP